MKKRKLLAASISGVVTYFVIEAHLRDIHPVIAAAVAGPIVELALSVITAVAVVSACLVVLVARSAGARTVLLALLLFPGIFVLARSWAGASALHALTLSAAGVTITLYVGAVVNVARIEASGVDEYEQAIFEDANALENHSYMRELIRTEHEVVLRAGRALSFFAVTALAFNASIFVFRAGWLISVVVVGATVAVLVFVKRTISHALGVEVEGSDDTEDDSADDRREGRAG